MFIEKAILKGESIMHDNKNIDSKTYLVTEIDPMFFLLKPLRSGVASGQKMMYQTLSQIIDSCIASSTHESGNHALFSINDSPVKGSDNLI
jgi:hypothetical protein